MSHIKVSTVETKVTLNLPSSPVLIWVNLNPPVPFLVYPDTPTRYSVNFSSPCSSTEVVEALVHVKFLEEPGRNAWYRTLYPKRIPFTRSSGIGLHCIDMDVELLLNTDVIVGGAHGTTNEK